MFIDFSYDDKSVSTLKINNDETKVLKIINIEQLFFLLDKVFYSTYGNKINDTLKKEVDEKIQKIYNSFVFAYEIIEFLNYNKIPKDEIKPTIIESFNKRLEVELNKFSIKEVTLIGTKYINRVKVSIKYNIKINEKNIIKISTNKDGIHFYDIKDFSNNNKYIINGDDQYESEMIYWILKDKYKIDDVENLSKNSDIYEYYKKFDKQEKYNEYEYISMERVEKAVNKIKIYKIKNYDLNYYIDKINSLDRKCFNNGFRNELVKEKHINVLTEILKKIITAFDNNNKKDISNYVHMFLINASIIEKKDYRPFKLYIYFLNILIAAFDNNESLHSFKYNFLLKYRFYSYAFSLKVEEERDLSKFIEYELNECLYKNKEFKNGIIEICKKLKVDFNLWNNILSSKGHTTSEFTNNALGKILREEDGFELDEEDINNNMLILVRMSYKIIRTFSLNNRWKINNPYIELFIRKLKAFRDRTMNNLENINSYSISRLTTLLSGYYSIATKYSYDNKLDNQKELVISFYNDLLRLCEIDLVVTYKGPAVKLIEDLGKVELLSNFYDLNLDVSSVYVKLYWKVNTIMSYMFSPDKTLYDVYPDINNYGAASTLEHANSILVSSLFINKKVLNVYSKGISIVKPFRLYTEAFKSVLRLFPDQEEKILYNEDEIKWEVTSDEIDWRAMY